MGVKIGRINKERQTIELSFHGNEGSWQMIIGFQQRGDVRKLMFVVPNIANLASRKRLECLEALMAVNYRIAIGKFGLDLSDGEIRLEESLPLANDSISFDQFRLTFNAIMQTVLIYHDLLPRIVNQNVSVQAALQTCENEFFEKEDHPTLISAHEEPARPTDRSSSMTEEALPELNVEDVLAEVSRLLGQRSE
jgi:hypothetical protein